MATASTGWACAHSASIQSENNTSVTIRVTCYWQNQGWRYNINNVSAWVYCNGSSYQVKSNSSVSAPSNTEAYSMGYHDFTISKGTSKQSISCYAKITSDSSYVSGTKSSSSTSVSVAAKPSYTVSYNANGGSGAPSSQTKWYGTTLTLSSTKPTRIGYSFQGWATSSSGSVAYAAGAKYTANAALTLYAVWKANTYTVSYDANGGSGAPSSQTKTYGVNLTLSSTEPTKTNYNFKGWSTSSSGSVVYSAGAIYTNNSSVTLYAIWELAYAKPRLNNFSVQRCNSDGTDNESGTYIKYTFDWATDYDVTSIWLDWSTNSDFSNYSNAQVTAASGTSGSVSQVVGNGKISTETSYYARASVSDSLDSTHSVVLSIGTIKFPIDVKNGGTGVSIGKASEKDAFEVEMDSYMNGRLLLTDSPPNFGGCRYTTEENSYVRLFTYTMRAQLKNTSIWFALCDTQNKHENLLCNLYARRGSDSEGMSVTSFKYMDNEESFDSDRLVAIVTDNNTIEVYFLMTVSDSPAITILSQTKMYSDNDSYGKIVIDCATTVTTLPSGDKTISSNTTNYPSKTLYYNSSGTNETITLNESATNFTYLEIFYCDNNNRDHESAKVYSPNGKTTSLSIIEASTNGNTYIRRTRYTISGTTIAPDVTNAGLVGFKNSVVSTENGTNYIKIVKVLGYK